jgi:pSer/pThr/pTyr-binding forkhead associated (FHA) protein
LFLEYNADFGRTPFPLPQVVQSDRQCNGRSQCQKIGALKGRMKNPFRRMEIYIENILEHPAGIFSGFSISSTRLWADLVLAIEEHSEPDATGHWISPNSIQIFLGTKVSDSSCTPSELQSYLQIRLQKHIRERSLLMHGPLSLVIHCDGQIPAHAIRINAVISDEENLPTNPFESEAPLPIHIPPGAFFIVDGNRHIPLEKPVVSIGRHLENQIALADPLISRRHVQLRAREGQFLLTDLGSKHGTRVNSIPVSECLLAAGDVVRIGHTELIYGDEREEDRTQPLAFETDSRHSTNPDGLKTV